MDNEEREELSYKILLDDFGQIREMFAECLLQTIQGRVELEKMF